MTRIIIKFGLMFEYYIFPLLIFQDVLKNLYFVVRLGPQIITQISLGLKIFRDFEQFMFLGQYLTTCFLTIFFVLIFLGLVLPKKLYKEPDSIAEVFIPLLSSFFYFMYTYLKYLPDAFQKVMIPDAFVPWCLLAGALLNIAGLVISIWGLYDLRRSFSMLIFVRDIVNRGSYRIVRHPIYLGYLISGLGLLLMNPMPGFLVLSVVYVILLIYRAYLEERKLLANSSEYRAYARKTPFLFPRGSRAGR